MLGRVTNNDRHNLGLALLSLIWMHLFPLLFQPLRGGSLANSLSCLAQTLWISYVVDLFISDPFQRSAVCILHTLGVAAIVLLPTDTEESRYYEREHWPSWVLSGWSLGLVLLLWILSNHLLMLTLCTIWMIVGWMIIFGIFWARGELRFPEAFVVPWTIQWLLGVLTLDIICYALFFPILSAKILGWLNVIYLLFEINRKIFDYKDTLQKLKSIVPAVISKLGIDLPKLRHIASHGFFVAKCVIGTIYVLTLGSGLGFTRIFVHETQAWGLFIVFLNALQNVGWLCKKVFESLFYTEDELRMLKTKSFAEMSPEEKVGMIMDKSAKTKKGLKSRERRIVNKATRQIEKQKR